MIVDLDSLPNPEDASTQDELAFVGLYVYVEAARLKISDAVTQMANWEHPVMGVVDREAKLEQWLDDAHCYLPDWYLAYEK